MLYSVGAVLNVLRWPVLWPGLFGSHELFHLFVLAGSLSHFRLAHDGFRGGANNWPIKAPRSLLPRARTLCTNSKNPR
jgi:Haemolysin-III related